jgi:hypothetical protein
VYSAAVRPCCNSNRPAEFAEQKLSSCDGQARTSKIKERRIGTTGTGVIFVILALGGSTMVRVLNSTNVCTAAQNLS